MEIEKEPTSVDVGSMLGLIAAETTTNKSPDFNFLMEWTSTKKIESFLDVSKSEVLLKELFVVISMLLMIK